MIKEDGYELYIKEYISGREVYDYRFYGVDVADKMDKNAIRDLIDEFKSGLIAKATNGDMSEKDYKRCRDILMQVPELNHIYLHLLKVIIRQTIFVVICKHITNIMQIDVH